MTHMKKLVIFDFDGTIADTSKSILGSIQYVQKQMGLPEISYEQKLSHIGPPMEESYARNFGLSGDLLEKAVSLHKEYAVKKGFLEVQIYSGIPELLQSLKANGRLVAVATLKNQTTVERIINHFELTDFFDFVKGTLPGKNTDKSALIKSCIKKFNAKESECIIVGDSIYDAVGAKELGVDFVGVTYGFGFRSQQEISVLKGAYSCNSATELQELIFSI